MSSKQATPIAAASPKMSSKHATPIAAASPKMSSKQATPIAIASPKPATPVVIASPKLASKQATPIAIASPKLASTQATPIAAASSKIMAQSPAVSAVKASMGKNSPLLKRALANITAITATNQSPMKKSATPRCDSVVAPIVTFSPAMSVLSASTKPSPAKVMDAFAFEEELPSTDVEMADATPAVEMEAPSSSQIMASDSFAEESAMVAADKEIHGAVVAALAIAATEPSSLTVLVAAADDRSLTPTTAAPSTDHLLFSPKKTPQSKKCTPQKVRAPELLSPRKNSRPSSAVSSRHGSAPSSAKRTSSAMLSFDDAPTKSPSTRAMEKFAFDATYSSSQMHAGSFDSGMTMDVAPFELPTSGTPKKVKSNPTTPVKQTMAKIKTPLTTLVARGQPLDEQSAMPMSMVALAEEQETSVSSTPKSTAGIASTSVVASSSKSVKFGPALSPEVFDKHRPASTPVKRGTPVKAGTPLAGEQHSVVLRSLLKKQMPLEMAEMSLTEATTTANQLDMEMDDIQSTPPVADYVHDGFYCEAAIEDASAPAIPQQATVAPVSATPQQQKLTVLDNSPAFRGVRELMRTPAEATEPVLVGLREMMNTPAVAKEPAMVGVREMMQTPKIQAPVDIEGVAALMQTPYVASAMVTISEETDVAPTRDSIVKEVIAAPAVALLAMPSACDSPSQAANMASSTAIMPVVRSASKNELIGIREMMKTPRAVPTMQFDGIAQMMHTPAAPTAHLTPAKLMGSAVDQFEDLDEEQEVVASVEAVEGDEVAAEETALSVVTEETPISMIVEEAPVSTVMEVAPISMVTEEAPTSLAVDETSISMTVESVQEETPVVEESSEMMVDMPIVTESVVEPVPEETAVEIPAIGDLMPKPVDKPVKRGRGKKEVATDKVAEVADVPSPKKTRASRGKKAEEMPTVDEVIRPTRGRGKKAAIAEDQNEETEVMPVVEVKPARSGRSKKVAAVEDNSVAEEPVSETRGSRRKMAASVPVEDEKITPVEKPKRGGKKVAMTVVAEDETPAVKPKRGASKKSEAVVATEEETPAVKPKRGTSKKSEVVVLAEETPAAKPARSGRGKKEAEEEPATKATSRKRKADPEPASATRSLRKRA